VIALDHLVVACRSLDAGRAWCESTLGVAPQPGGRHALMGTHNLLLAVASERFPRAYLELIAIDAAAPEPGQPRWFDLDDAELQGALAEPRLVHWVARSSDIEADAAMLRRAGHETGRIVDAERMTPAGLLRWRITLPVDGRRPARGAVPLLIGWGAGHPTETLPASGVSLHSLEIGGVGETLAASLGVDWDGANGPPLTAVLRAPRGDVELTAPPWPAFGREP
jgi:hypothetical protein